MNSLPLKPEIEAIVRRVIWFEPPAQSLADTVRFLSYAMTYGDDAEMRPIRRNLLGDDLRAALDHAPAGIFDPRSWRIGI